MAPSATSSLPLLPEPHSRLRTATLAVLVLAPLVIGALGVMMGQSVIWDLRNYHWYNAYALLTGRYAAGVDFQPSQIEFFHNPAIDVPFYWLGTHLPVKAAFFILGVAQGLNFPLLFMLAHALLKIATPRERAGAALLLAALGMAGGMGISEFGVPFYDNIASLGVLLSALLVVARLDLMMTLPWRTAARLAWLAALPVGIAAGLKLTTMIFCVGLCAGFPLATRLNDRGIVLGFFFGLGVLAGVAAAYGYWGWYLYAHYGSPMFPYFNRIFGSPYVARGYIEDFRAPTGLAVPLLFPFLFTADSTRVNEIPFSDWRIVILYVLAIAVGLLVIFRRRKEQTLPLPPAYLLTAVAVSYAAWISIEAYYRYILAIEMLAPLLIVVCIGLFPLKPRVSVALTALLLAAVAFSVKPAHWERRGSWAGNIAKVSLPAIKDPARTMVLMGGDDGYAYMVPAFPPQMSFVRMESRGLPLSYGWGTNNLIRARIRAHHGPMLLFISKRELKTGEEELAYFGLKTDATACRTVTDDIAETDTADFPKYYALCSVTRR